MMWWYCCVAKNIPSGFNRSSRDHRTSNRMENFIQRKGRLKICGWGKYGFVEQMENIFKTCLQ